ncbi:MAG: PSD1 and planctomycete cytochrome C domain-containing protein [Fuerstiella sp.]
MIAPLNADEPPAPEAVEYFEKQVRPLLIARCYSCHSQKAGKQEGGLLLDSRPGWIQGGDNGPALTPGDTDHSLLIRAVRYTDPDLQMPPDKALPPDAVAVLEEWVRMGAPDPRTSSAVDAASHQDPSDPVAGRTHWAFQPLGGEHVPAVEATDWPRSPIDAFVLARLEQQQLQPAADADRRTLIRRLYFQLTGLPPAPEDVAEFLEDKQPDAVERLVDRLLNSTQFGECWGRHWLDLARYADSNGLDENFLFREAWRYRNWVIDAVNADLPYDQFLLQQIAGDLLPWDSIEQRDRQRIGAGFLVVGPKVLLGNDPNERIMDVADEQLDTIGKTVLGQTLGCARCHDHKFDPIPTADYYALAGILTSTEVMEQRYMLGQQRVMERLAGLGAQGDEADGAYETYWRERPQRQDNLKHGKSALELLEKNDLPAVRKLAEAHAGVVAAVALDEQQTMAARLEAQKALVAELEAAAAPPQIPPRAMIPGDRAKPRDEAIRLAGQFNKPGKTIPRGVLHVISETGIRMPEHESGRVELARWLTDTDDGAGHLAARVMANRVWHHLIGRGLVRTVDNFGRTGEPPTHPELLDHLARELIESGWSVRTLIRQIVLSRTFAMSSRDNESGRLADPENQWLWRAHRRRLGPESLRDAMLAAAGTLDLTPMDSTVSYLGDQATAVGENKNRRRTDFPCRSVYLPVIRNDLPEVFDVFDFADPHATTGLRPQTMVAPQGLFILNDALVMDAATATARRVLAEVAGSGDTHGDDALPAIADRMFELVLNALPEDTEQAELIAFVRSAEQHFAAVGREEPKLRAWAAACQALFASSRFQILDDIGLGPE